jgi:hypothetical protein
MKSKNKEMAYRRARASFIDSCFAWPALKLASGFPEVASDRHPVRLVEVLVLLLRFNPQAADFADDELIVLRGFRLVPREALVHVRGNPEHVVFVAFVAKVPPTKQAPDGGLSLPAVLADDHERAAP